jgi:hypothetical protein
MAPRADSLLTPLEALRVFVRVLYPQRPWLADEIKTIDWFVHWKRDGVSPEEHNIASRARDFLNKSVRKHTIRLRGVLDDGTPREPQDIDSLYCKEGELDIWKQTLEVASDRKVYRLVYCVADGVHQQAESTAGKPLPDAVEQSSQLKSAPKADVVEAIRSAYDAADAAGGKPPNIKELPGAVLPLLKEKGYSASGRRIAQLGEGPEFKRRRRRPGDRSKFRT